MSKIDLGGIDVSARTLDLAVERAGQVRTAQFSNDSEGHRKLCRHLTRGRSARVCLEATGVYHLDLALALHRHARIEVMVVHPKASRDFAAALLKRSKTDPVDAAVLLEYARRMPYAPWDPPAQEIFDLRGLARRIVALTKTRAQEKNRLHAAEVQQELTIEVAEDIEDSRRDLADRIARLEHKAVAYIDKNPMLRRRYAQLLSIPGVAAKSAIQILAELAVLPGDMSARQWVAHAGLDPAIQQSGTSLKRRTRISRKGNARLRAPLYMPALSAIRTDPHVRAFSQRLRDAGKTPLQAVVAVMRKLLHAIHGMFQSYTDFHGARFTALP